MVYDKHTGKDYYVAGIKRSDLSTLYKMKWKNLKNEKCPKCGAYLQKGTMYFCEFCSFRISFGKAFGISGTRADLEEEADNLLRRNRKQRN